MSISSRNLNRIRGLALAVVTATAVAAVPQAASATAVPMAIPADITQLSSTSSQLVIPSIKLPDNVYAAADRFGVLLPDFLRNPQALSNAFSGERSALNAATAKNLAKQGHHSDTKAQNYAQEWADQAARGDVVFVGNVGRGTTHLDEGDGNVYKLSAVEANDRVAWLNRDISVNVLPQAKGFGVATATDGNFIYVAEFFLN